MNPKILRRSLSCCDLAIDDTRHAFRSPCSIQRAAGENWSGKVEGKAAGPVQAFLGIPYAAPPVGDLRWKAPAPAAKWSGVRKATEFGAHCMQGQLSAT